MKEIRNMDLISEKEFYNQLINRENFKQFYISNKYLFINTTFYNDFLELELFLQGKYYYYFKDFIISNTNNLFLIVSEIDDILSKNYYKKNIYYNNIKTLYQRYAEEYKYILKTYNKVMELKLDNEKIYNKLVKENKK